MLENSIKAKDMKQAKDLIYMGAVYAAEEEKPNKEKKAAAASSGGGEDDDDDDDGGSSSGGGGGVGAIRAKTVVYFSLTERPLIFFADSPVHLQTINNAATAAVQPGNLVPFFLLASGGDYRMMQDGGEEGQRKRRRLNSDSGSPTQADPSCSSTANSGVGGSGRGSGVGSGGGDDTDEDLTPSKKARRRRRGKKTRKHSIQMLYMLTRPARVQTFNYITHAMSLLWESKICFQGGYGWGGANVCEFTPAVVGSLMHLANMADPRYLSFLYQVRTRTY